MQASSPDSSRLHGCSLSLLTVGDLLTAKPEARTTSCRRTQDKKQDEEEEPGIKLRAWSDKYGSFIPEGGQIDEADVASWETLSKMWQQTDDKLVWKVETAFLFGLSALKSALRADKGTADSLNNHVTQTHGWQTSDLQPTSRLRRALRPKTQWDAGDSRIIPGVFTVPVQVSDTSDAL